MPLTKLKFIAPILLLGVLVLVGAGCRDRDEATEGTEKKELVQHQGSCNGLSFVWFAGVECSTDKECSAWVEENKEGLEAFGIDKDNLSCCSHLGRCGYYEVKLNIKEIVEHALREIEKKYEIICVSSCERSTCSSCLQREWGEQTYITYVYDKPQTKTIELHTITNFRINATPKQFATFDYKAIDYEEAVRKGEFKEIRISGQKVYQKIEPEYPTEYQEWPEACWSSSPGDYQVVVENLAVILGGYAFQVRVQESGGLEAVVDEEPFAEYRPGHGVFYDYCVDEPELGKEIMEILIDDIIH